MASIEQMRREGLDDQEIGDLMEGERYINNEIIPAFLKLPNVRAVYGDDHVPNNLHQIGYTEWYSNRDLCADLRPARRSYVDEYGQIARFVVISATPEQWREMWRKKAYGDRA